MISVCRPGETPVGSDGVNMFHTITLNAPIVLGAVGTLGGAIIVGWRLTRVMQQKRFKAILWTNLTACAVMTAALYLRFGLSATTLQGILLSFVLLYASASDMTSHTMDDFLWVMVILLGVGSVDRVGIGSMLLGAVLVFVPQLLVAIIGKSALGGADIKLSSALAFLLGWQRGLTALAGGLLLAVLVEGVRRAVVKPSKREPFALIPFLSVAAMGAFLL